MKPVIFAILAITLYALTSVVVEQKLGRFSNLALTFLFTLPFIPLSLIFLSSSKLLNEEPVFPKGGYFWLTMLLGAIYFLADYFYIGAFTSGGNVITIATILLLGPVIVSIFRHFWVGGYPNTYQFLGYILVVIAVLLITKGSFSSVGLE